MVNLPKKFSIGDKVFAKVRGYPPWPAKIEKVVDPNTKNARYSVYFYGTGETALCKVEDIFDYLENKAKYGKTVRRKFFNEGIQQLEEELGIVAPASASVKKDISDAPPAVQENFSYKSDDGANESATATSSDTESKLVIDEREPKKGLKRKSVVSQNITPDVPEVKKRKVGRPPLSESKKYQQQQLEISKQLEPPRDTGVDSQDEESSGKEMTSRSGRKIKPKRYTDFEDTPEVQKSEHTGRAKTKQKFEENENQSSVNSPLPKKKATLEKVHNSVTSPSSKTETETSSNYVLIRTFSGEFVGIKIKNDGDKTHEQWDWSAARDVLKLKAQLENGEILPEQVKDKLEFNVSVTEENKRSLAKDNTFFDKCKEKWLHVQRQLLMSDQQIRANLSLERANCDESLEAMDNFLSLPIDALMLLNSPVTVETVKRLRSYIGNLGAWNLTDEEMNIFKKKAEQIRTKAEDILNRFKGMFTIPEGLSFWQMFMERVTQYEKLTKNLSDDEKWSSFIDPFNNESIAVNTKVDESSDKTKSDVDKAKSEKEAAKHEESEVSSEIDKSESELETTAPHKNSDENDSITAKTDAN